MAALVGTVMALLNNPIFLIAVILVAAALVFTYKPKRKGSPPVRRGLPVIGMQRRWIFFLIF